MLLKITKNRKMCKQSNLNIPRNVSVDAKYSRGGLPEELLHKTYHVKIIPTIRVRYQDRYRDALGAPFATKAHYLFF